MKEGSGKWFLALGGTVAGAAVIAAGIWIWGPEASETDFDQEVSALIFRDGKIQPASDLDPSDRAAGNLSFTYEDGALSFQFSCDEKNVNGTVNPLPGQNPYYEGDVVLFIPETLAEGYSLMSCRIETLANSASLIPDNLDYEGHTILALGIRDDETQDIYYVQECIDSVPVEDMVADARENFEASEYTEEDMYALEHRYITLMEQ